MERALHLGLPRQGVDDLVEMKGGLHARERVPKSVCELKVCHQAKWIRHGHNPLLQFDPVPSHTCRGLGHWIAPNGLAGARMFIVGSAKDACAKMYELQFGRTFSLPQYGGPRAYDPGGSHR